MSRGFNDFDDEDEAPRRPARERRFNDDEQRDDYDDNQHRYYQPHRGGLILALGLIAWLVCGLVGFAAWFMGKADLAEMDAGRMDPTGRGMTQAGYILGMIMSIFQIVLLFGFLALFVCGAAGAIK